MGEAAWHPDLLRSSGDVAKPTVVASPPAKPNAQTGDPYQMAAHRNHWIKGAAVGGFGWEIPKVQDERTPGPPSEAPGLQCPRAAHRECQAGAFGSRSGYGQASSPKLVYHQRAVAVGCKPPNVVHYRAITSCNAASYPSIIRFKEKSV